MATQNKDHTVNMMCVGVVRQLQACVLRDRRYNFYGPFLFMMPGHRHDGMSLEAILGRDMKPRA